ncbi:MAG: hypothetical protein AB8I08_09805 [Sandaracinaceae bacterium]
MRCPWIAIAALAVACSGPEHEPDRPAAPQQASSTAEAPTEPHAPASTSAPARPACESDADCMMHTPCCVCPPVPQALHTDEVEEARQLCTRVRCAACGLQPPEGPDQVARCRNAVCVAEPAPLDTTACRTDADCEMITPCCACPLDPVAMNRTAAAAVREECTMIDCSVCEAPPSARPPETARCQSSICVAVSAP